MTATFVTQSALIGPVSWEGGNAIWLSGESMLGLAHLLLNDDSDALTAEYVVVSISIAVVLITAASTLSNALNAVASRIRAALNSQA
jgi:Flp pilus assembly pilin Flp